MTVAVPFTTVEEISPILTLPVALPGVQITFTVAL
jgi:hypothetical protein